MLLQATRTAEIAVPQYLYRHISYRTRSKPSSFLECQPVLWPQHRRMVTHRSQPLQSSSILSDTLSRGGSGGSNSGVGPFQLGIRPNDYGRGEPVKKWKELSASGKGAWSWPRILAPAEIRPHSGPSDGSDKQSLRNPRWWWPCGVNRICTRNGNGFL
jgi:hypothetical protein